MKSCVSDTLVKHITNFVELKPKLKRVVWLYNNELPHLNLYNYYSPVNFEQYLLTIDTDQKPEMTVYSEENNKNNSYQQKKKRSKKRKFIS